MKMVILVIEDEAMERETLVSILQQAFSNVEVVSAKNGVEALSIYEKKHPSIILADINIPQISGLEVIRRIREVHQNCVFLVVSSYNYFHYAQEAIRLGVDDFILKPYAIDHLLEAVERAMQKLDEQKDEQQRRSELLDKLEKYTPVMESECFYTILSNQDELQLKRSISLLNDHLIAGFSMICLKSEIREQIVNRMKQQGYRVLSEKVHGSYIFFILMNHWPKEEEKAQLSPYFITWKQEDEGVQIGSIQEDVCLYTSYLHAKSNEACKFVIPQVMKEVQDMSNEQMIARMQALFEAMDEEKIKKEIMNDTAFLLSKTRKEIVEGISAFMDSLLIYLKERYPDINISACPEILINHNPHQEIAYYLNAHIMKYYQTMMDETFKNANQLVRQAMKYIDTNYKRPITLNDLADSLNVSPFYISKLLNNTLKKTFTELVSEKRVEVSKELLKTNKRIKEIAYEVGFQGQNYFTKIFKKYTGVTPKVYKNTFEE